MAALIGRSSIGNRQSSIVFLRGQCLPYLAIIALYLSCAVLVDPRGEFPLNDDWTYARSAFRFGTEGRMKLDEWSAPSLIGQAFYGGLLARLLGPGFLALRLSTLALSCALACLIWGACSRLGVRAGLAWLAVLSWIFNPVGFCVSFTYMTEIPFLFFVMFALFAFLCHLRTGKFWQLLACGGLLGYAYLIRQTALLFMAPLFAILVMSLKRANPRQGIIRCLLWTGTAGIFIVGFALWINHQGGFTPAAQRKFELLAKINTTQILGNTFGLLFYLSFYMLPLLIALTPRWGQICRSSGSTAWIWTGVWILISGAGLGWFKVNYSGVPYLPARPFHSQMPYLLNILYDTGLGPITLDPTYYGRAPVPSYPALWLAATIIIAAGVAILGPLMTYSSFWRRRWPGDPAFRPFHLLTVLCFLCAFAFEVVFSHVQEGGLFDRHILTAALPLMLVLLSFETRPDSVGSGSRLNPGNESPATDGSDGLAAKARIPFTLAAGILLAVFAWFSIAWTHDYLAWNRLRWEMGRELLAAKIDPLSISGGFEFNAWHNYDTFRVRGNVGRIYYWWYDRPDYLITMEPQEAYTEMSKREYFSWLHRKSLPVYVLKKEEKS